MSGCPDFDPRLQHGAFGLGFAGARGPGSSRTIAEHLNCSLMLLGFLPMHSGSQQCFNVATYQVTFTDLGSSSWFAPEQRSKITGQDYLQVVKGPLGEKAEVELTEVVGSLRVQ